MVPDAQRARDDEWRTRRLLRPLRDANNERRAIKGLIVEAYPWQYIVTGVRHRHFARLLEEFTTPAQMQRIQHALAPIVSGF